MKNTIETIITDDIFPSWTGYPYDRNTVINYIKQNNSNIKFIDNKNKIKL